MNELHNVAVIAKKEFLDNWRNKWILAITAIFLILTLVTSYFGSEGGEAGWRSISATIAVMTAFVLLLIPIIALMLGYASIVGEKEKGSLGVLLSYPVSRAEIVMGKFVGLGLVVSTAILFGFGIAGIIIGINTKSMDFGKYGLFIISSILFGLSYLAIAILISSLLKKRSTAMGAAIFLWFFFAIIWGMIVLGVLSLSGWEITSTQTISQINVYDGGNSFEINEIGKSIAYGNGNIYLLGNGIIEYNLSSHSMKKNPIPSHNYVSISYKNGNLYLAGDKALIYSIDKKEWKTINISCNDISYCNGSIYMLNFFKLIQYNEGKFKNISLPSICYSISCGEDKIYLASQSLIEYDIKNGTFSNYSLPETKIYDIAYGDGNVYILGSKSFSFNTTSKETREIFMEGSSIAYGDGKIFTLEQKSKMRLQQFPTWYYVSDFFNPVQIYRGIIALNIEFGMEDFKELYPSFYNTSSLTLSLIIWILAPLVASIYFFKRRDI